MHKAARSLCGYGRTSLFFIIRWAKKCVNAHRQAQILPRIHTYKHKKGGKRRHFVSARAFPYMEIRMICSAEGFSSIRKDILLETSKRTVNGKISAGSKGTRIPCQINGDCLKLLRFPKPVHGSHCVPLLDQGDQCRRVQRQIRANIPRTDAVENIS